MANEWCASAGVAQRTADASASPATVQPLVGFFIRSILLSITASRAHRYPRPARFAAAIPAQPLNFSKFLFEKIEYILRQRVVRPLPALLEPLLPVLCPGAAIIIDVTGIVLRELRRPAVGVPEIAQAL